MNTQQVYASWIIIIVTVSSSWLPSLAATPVRKCADETKPLPLMVEIDDCADMPCNMWKGNDMNMKIQFLATKNLMRQLVAKVHLTTLGVTIPYDLEAKRSNVCENLLDEAYCPLYAGEDVTYALALPVSESQPEVPTKLEVTLLDESDDSVVACFIADTRVKRPN